MIPYLDLPSFHVGAFEIQPFGVLVCIGIVVGTILAERRARRVGLDPGVVRNFVRLSAVLGVFGSHVVDLAMNHPEQLRSDPWSLLRFWSGLSSFGGFICAALAVIVYVRRRGIPLLPYADVFMFGFFPMWFFARSGCATAHDHPGYLSDFFLAVKFPGGARHDLGLYEALLGFVWVPFMHWLGRKNDVNDPPPGSILAAMVIAYSVPRFFLDFLREYDLRYFGLTFAQYGCVVFTALGASFLIRLRARRRASSMTKIRG